MKLGKMALLVALILIVAGLAGCGATIPSELSVAEYPLTQRPEAESEVLTFADSVQEDPRSLHAAEREQHFADTGCTVGNSFGNCVTLDGDRLFATQDYTDPSTGYVVVTRQDQQVYKVPVGPASPISGLWGLWTYEGHWALETALIGNPESSNEPTTATGQVTVDGESLNEKKGYEESFGFQMLGGKPFYFYKHEGKIDANYGGVDIALGYDEVPHYNCCSAGSFNPRAYPNLVTFFGRRGDAWYYGEIGVFGRP